MQYRDGQTFNQAEKILSGIVNSMAVYYQTGAATQCRKHFLTESVEAAQASEGGQ